jgi:hypothetical protein
MSKPQWQRVTEYIMGHPGCTAIEIQNLVPPIPQYQRAVYDARHHHGQDIVSVPPDATHKYHRFYHYGKRKPGEVYQPELGIA